MAKQRTSGKGRARRSSNGGRSRRQRSGSSKNALSLLRKDHQEVSKLFDKYEGGKARLEEEAKRQLAQKICSELTVHATIEEEIFYPAIRETFPNQADTLDEAEVEHASVKELVSQLEAADPDEELFDAKVKVLGEYVKHHVKEEHALFAEIGSSRKMDFESLGERLSERKQALKSGSMLPAGHEEGVRGERTVQ